MDNQAETLEEELQPVIAEIRLALIEGQSPAALANELHQRGYGTIRIIVVFRKAAGITLRDAKMMGLWWGPNGVTDPEAFDTAARRLLSLTMEQNSPRGG